MKKTAVFKDLIFLEHMAGFSHIESADRLIAIYDALNTETIGKEILYPQFSAADYETLGLIHTQSYLKQVAATEGKAQVSLDPDTQTSPRSYEASCLAAGATVSCTQQVLSGAIANGFCLVRPPGHHAEADQAKGFCLFNNVAIAAQYAIAKMNLSRVLIVDWDLHHGNGTQHSFYDTNKVLYFSTHQYPYYPGTGAHYEVGNGQGEGYTINVPLSLGQGDHAFATIFNELLVPIAEQYKPELILLSAGFDTHIRDPLGGMQVSSKGYAYMAKVLLDLAQDLCQGRFVAALEGGYDLIALREGVLAVLREMAGQTILSEKDLLDLTATSLPIPGFGEVLNVAKQYWKV